jgi:hypothetical protein
MNLNGELALTADELATIQTARPRQINGLLEPGLVSFPVSADDRLARHPEGFVALTDVVGTFYGVAHLQAVPIVDPTERPAPNLSTRQCQPGQHGEWWVILPGGAIFLLEPDEPYRIGDYLALFNVLDPNAVVRPARAPSQVDVSLRGVAR